MDQYQNYINSLMVNHSLSAEKSSEYDYTKYQTGGSGSGPTGGFPPIYECNEKDSDAFSGDRTDTTKKRELSSAPKAVPLKDILKKRGEVTPFLSLSGISPASSESGDSSISSHYSNHKSKKVKRIKVKYLTPPQTPSRDIKL